MENDFDDAEALWDQLEKRQFWPTVTTNNFGSTTTVTIYGTLVTITAWTGSSTTVYISTEPTATSYSTPTPALTTIFTPPSSCLSEIVWEANTVWQIAPLYETQCYPYGYATSIYYSPGICPSGYMMGEQTLHSIIQGTSTAWETYAACCPSGYIYVSEYDEIPCASSFNPPYTSGTFLSSPTTTSTFTLTLPYLTSWTSTINSQTITSTLSANTIATDTAGVIWCASIQVRWQSTDTEILSLLSLVGETAPPTSPPTPNPNQPPKTGSSNTGKIVAGVLVPVLIIAFSVIVVLFWLRRRRAFGVGRPMLSESDGEAARVTYEKPQPQHQVAAVPQHPRSELDSWVSQPAVVMQPEPLSGERGFEPPVQDQYDRPTVEHSAATPQQHYAPPTRQPALIPFSLRAGLMAEMPTKAFTPPPREQTDPHTQPSVPSANPNFADHTSPAIPMPAAQVIPVDQPATASHRVSPTSSAPIITSFPVADTSQYQASPPARSSSPTSTTLSRTESSNLQTLQTEYAKVVEERARLSRLQELADLESKLREQIEEQIGKRS